MIDLKYFIFLTCLTSQVWLLPSPQPFGVLSDWFGSSIGGSAVGGGGGGGYNYPRPTYDFSPNYNYYTPGSGYYPSFNRGYGYRSTRPFYGGGGIGGGSSYDTRNYFNTLGLGDYGPSNNYPYSAAGGGYNYPIGSGGGTYRSPNYVRGYGGGTLPQLNNSPTYSSKYTP